MSKPSRRPGREFAKAQARIQAEAERVRSAPRLRVRPADETPALAGVLTAIRSAIEEGLPTKVVHAGTRYKVILSGAVRVEVFRADKPDELLFSGGTWFDSPMPDD